MMNAMPPMDPFTMNFKALPHPLAGGATNSLKDGNQTLTSP